VAKLTPGRSGAELKNLVNQCFMANFKRCKAEKKEI